MRRRTGKRVADATWEKFLAAFAEHGNVTLAAKACGLGRRTVYDKLAGDAEFKARFRDAEESAIDLLEAEAWRRAVAGVEKPVMSAGKIVTFVRDYSDGLMTLLLRANRPMKYRDRVEMSGNAAAPAKVESARERIARRLAARSSDGGTDEDLGGSHG